jgi:hypothetical protein
MGRYAFFSTGLEYKFAFATQESSDITKFGGWVHSETKIIWSSKEKDILLTRIRSLEHILGRSEFDFSQFEMSLEGTYEMRESIDVKHSYSPLIYTYLLGCLIYHQLLYTDVLICSFEW